MGKYPCKICSKEVRSAGVFCTGECNSWIHFSCLGITYSDLKHLDNHELEQWQCSNCLKVIEDEKNSNALSESSFLGNNNLLADSSSILSEIQEAIIHENEELKQALHDEKNKSVMHDLELEDILKVKEDEINQLKQHADNKVTEMEFRINYLERMVKEEKALNEKLLVDVAQTEENQRLQLISEQHKTVCKKCIILSEETHKMLSTIKSLESLIVTLQNEISLLKIKLEEKEQDNKMCLSCYPPLLPSKRTQKHPLAKRGQNSMSTAVAKNCCDVRPKSNLISRNRFDVLSELPSDNEELNDVDKGASLNKYPKTSHKKHFTHRLSFNPAQNRCDDTQSGTKKILLCTDSHGRDLSFHINNNLASNPATGFVRPGGRAEEVLNPTNISEEKLKSDDFLVIMCGTNDVAHNEAQLAINSISSTLDTFANNRVVLVDLPVRHDLKSWSVVNEEIRKTNLLLKELSSRYANVDFVEASLAERSLHTQHGMHFNRRGKRWLALEISKLVSKVKVSPDTVKASNIITGSTMSSPSSAEMTTKQDKVLAQETLVVEDQLVKETLSTSGNISPSGNETQLQPQDLP